MSKSLNLTTARQAVEFASESCMVGIETCLKTVESWSKPQSQDQNRRVVVITVDSGLEPQSRSQNRNVEVETVSHRVIVRPQRFERCDFRWTRISNIYLVLNLIYFWCKKPSNHTGFLWPHSYVQILALLSHMRMFYCGDNNIVYYLCTICTSVLYVHEIWHEGNTQ